MPNETLCNVCDDGSLRRWIGGYIGEVDGEYLVITDAELCICRNCGHMEITDAEKKRWQENQQRYTRLNRPPPDV